MAKGIQGVDLEVLVISLIFHEKINIFEFSFKKDMFDNKINYQYVDYLKEQSGVSHKSIFELNQNFLTKTGISVYDLAFINSLLQKYSTDTILDLFFQSLVEKIWEKKKLEDYSNSNLEEMLDLINEMREHIFDVQSKKIKKNPYESFREHILDIKAKIASGEMDEGVTGIKSDIFELDLITGGFRQGEYTIIAGRPSMGKTSLALDVCISALMQEKSVLFLSIEMTSEQLIARLIPKINHSLTLENTVNAKDIESKHEEILQASVFLENSKLEIDDFDSDVMVTKKEILRSFDNYFKKFGCYPDIVVLDYIQIVKADNQSNENTLITEISNMLQRLAKKTKSSLIALSQLNRTLEERTDKRPTNADLRGSGSLEQDADRIIFTYRDDVYLEKRLREALMKKPDSRDHAEAITNLMAKTVQSSELIVGKNRNGRVGTANTKFHTKTATYTDSPEKFDLNDF